MIKNNLNYVYRGSFSDKVTDRLLSLAEKNLENIGEASKVRKKVYFIMVECLQNITRHQLEKENEEDDKSGIFMIKKIGEEYYITSGNPIKNKNVESLKNQLNKINSLEKDELKALKQEILESGIFSDKGGAGLGLIEMARKSGQKLEFDFQPVNDELSFFYLQTKIPTSIKAEKEDSIIDKELKTSISAVRLFHETMIAKNLILIYEGEFNQDIINNVLYMTEGSLEKDKEELAVKKY